MTTTSTLSGNFLSGKTSSKAELNNSVVSPKELCKIIEVCAAQGVHEFNFNGIYLVFGGADQPTQKHSPIKTKSGQANKITEEAEAQQLAFQREQSLEELRLTDPLAYERLIEGELEDVRETP